MPRNTTHDRGVLHYAADVVIGTIWDIEMYVIHPYISSTQAQNL